ncbi:hypothetical protein AVEN_197128-1, partial [Araneus ventricosus]
AVNSNRAQWLTHTGGKKDWSQAIRGLFGDGPRHFESRSDDKDDIGAATSFPNFHTAPAEERLPPYV